MPSLFFKGLTSLREDGVKKTWERVQRKLLQNNRNTQVHTKEEAESKYPEDLSYHSLYQADQVQKSIKPDVKLLAFHLPQYHTFKENDEWWGKGFTEWTLTRKSLPRFGGHYQPRVPHPDIGYYDLTDLETWKKQAQMLKNHGIYGFCFYYYWFSGKRLMEKSVDLLLTHPEIDIKFCLCWANENWTRTWDGLKNNILIAQEYSDKDPILFISDIKKYLKDPRYIRVQGKPVIIVYNCQEIPNCASVLKIWRKEAQKQGIGDIAIWVCRTFGQTAESLGIRDLVDKEVEFPPHNSFAPRLPIEIEGNLFNYSEYVEKILERRACEAKNENVFRTAMFGWDNAPRRATGFNTFVAFDIYKYYEWIKANVDEAKYFPNPEERFTLINAWNEWGEGTYLEPDEKYGYTNLNVTTQALCHQDFNVKKTWVRNDKAHSKIAVQVHLYYLELIEEIYQYLCNITESFDCFVSTCTCENVDLILTKFKNLEFCQQLEVRLFPNKGRDVGPMLIQLKERAKNYDLICHIHTKSSKHLMQSTASQWRQHLLGSLLGNKTQSRKIIETLLNDEKVGLIIPSHSPAITHFIGWGGNKTFANQVLNTIGLPSVTFDKIWVFPSGNMFWCKSQAVRQIFEYDWRLEDFPQESGQVDGTIMHAIERTWGLVCNYNGYVVKFIDETNSKTHLEPFVRFDDRQGGSRVELICL